ncbi:hypothetical protein [Synechococcus sp. TAK9802]|uniref:hypothetical protein n=1 Tax=Synechococcus sp. TAK9802 TaxID=1442558 RepID=UPI00164974E8|nr:hypothetical protein [Synechococcus sp. TAK9802]QNI60794.1 hypothetical protein SynTAK9802_00484 [Synechococcus sp. TAK9802]
MRGNVKSDFKEKISCNKLYTIQIDKMIEPNWDYFINAPLDEGVIRFETKAERALHAMVVATEANWIECKSSECLAKWWRAKKDLAAYRQGQEIRRKREML